MTDDEERLVFCLYDLITAMRLDISLMHMLYGIDPETHHPRLSQAVPIALDLIKEKNYDLWVIMQ